MYKKMKNVFIFVIIFFLASCGSEWERRNRRAKKLSQSKKLEKWEEAIKEYDKIIKMKVNAREYQAFIYRKLGKRHLQMKHWNDALYNYKKALEILPNEAILHCRIGVCYSQLYKSEYNKEKKMELVEKAEERYKKTIELNPEIVDSYFGLGVIYSYIYKNYTKAIKYMKKVIEINNRDIDAHFALGRFYYEKGDLEYAKTGGKTGNWRRYFTRSLEYYKSLIGLVPEKEERYKQVLKNIQRINYELAGGPQ